MPVAAGFAGSSRLTPILKSALILAGSMIGAGALTTHPVIDFRSQGFAVISQ